MRYCPILIFNYHNWLPASLHPRLNSTEASSVLSVFRFLRRREEKDVINPFVRGKTRRTTHEAPPRGKRGVSCSSRASLRVCRTAQRLTPTHRRRKREDERNQRRSAKKTKNVFFFFSSRFQRPSQVRGLTFCCSRARGSRRRRSAWEQAVVYAVRKQARSR